MSHDKDLDQLFEQARAKPPEPSADFLARVLSDGEQMQPAPRGVMEPAKAKRRSFMDIGAMFGDMIGGWPTMAGLATAAVTGIWIGVSPPQSLITPIDTAFGGNSAALSEALDYGDGFDFTQYEG